MAPVGSVVLDYTLHDLYLLDNETAHNIILVYYPVLFKAARTATSNLLSSVKFAYWDSLPKNHNDDDGEEADCSVLAHKIIPQRYGFCAGEMPLVIFEDNNSTRIKADAHPVFSQLPPGQRPSLIYVENPADIPLQLANSQLAVLFPNDRLSDLPHVIDPEVHYEILSKRGLAESRLPTPMTTIIDPVLSPDQLQDETLLQAEISRIISSFDQHPLPFIIKLQQTVSGYGTFKVYTDADREAMKQLFSTKLLREILRQTNASNNHLYPSSLVIQKMIPGEAMALSLFITRKGRAIIIACSGQGFNEEGHWTGASISYAQQAVLKERHSNTADAVARFLHQRGYYGPAGADVITIPSSGEQFVVDLNVRVTGAYALGLLAGHFTRRGLFEATLLTIYLPCTKTAFECAFEGELKDGCIVITGWAQDSRKALSHAGIIVGGKDFLELDRLVKSVYAMSGVETTKCVTN